MSFFCVKIKNSKSSHQKFMFVLIRANYFVVGANSCKNVYLYDVIRHAWAPTLKKSNCIKDTFTLYTILKSLFL